MASDDQPSGARRYAPIGKYEILSHIATGGMGVVYRARNTETGQTVALKVLSPQRSTSPIILERFRREAIRGIKLHHDNLVAIHEFREENGIYYLAEEFVDGLDLHDYIARKKKLDVNEACSLLIQAARALDYLHGNNVVHRDIKPSNFLIRETDNGPAVKLTDFGLARELSDEEFRVTRADFTVGTVDYMSPEQARNSGAADARSDIYSLGCTFFHMLAGRPPFNEGGLTERLYKHAEAEPPDVRRFNPTVSASVVKILRRMLAKKPDERYQTPAALLEDLLHVTRQGADPGPRPVDTDTAEFRVVERTTPVETVSTTFASARESSDEQTAALDPISPLIPVLNEDQRQAADGQYERGKQVLGSGRSVRAG